MELTVADTALLAALQNGLPLEPKPYAALGRSVGMTEAEVLDRLAALQAQGTIQRMGVIVKHRALGYRANAMVVWDIPDSQVAETGRAFSTYPFVTLCYRRPRRLPEWPYNLFCMIHGRSRQVVEEQIGRLRSECGLEAIPHAVLFSRRAFKQRGQRFLSTGTAATAMTGDSRG